MKKRALIILMCIIMVASMFTGCGKTPTDGKKGQDGEEKLEPITFKFFSADAGAAGSYENFESQVSKEIQKRTGVTIETEYVVGDPKQKLSLMVAGEEYPDFIYGVEFSNIIVDGGGFIPLDDLIEQHAPNIKRVYGDYLKRCRYSKEKPNIYILGTPTVNEVKFEPASGFEIQHAALKELGYPKLETLKDLENAIKAYKDKHPTIDGKPTIGLSLLADDWRIKITVTNPAVFATGGPDDGEWYWDEGKEKAMLHLRRPEEKEYFRWLNHMNDIKLLDPESFTQKYDQYEAKIASGRVIALADSKWEYTQAEEALISGGMPERTYATFPLQLDKTTKNADFRPEGYAGGYGIGITKSCKDPVRAIKFLDWLCSDEGQILARWGLEGVHYDVVDGKRKFKPEVWERMKTDSVNYSKETGIGWWSWPWPGYGQGAKDAKEDFYSPVFTENIIDGYPEPAKETLKAYGAEMWRDLYPKPEEFKPSKTGALWLINIPADSEANLIMKKYDEEVQKHMAEAVTCAPSDFDKVWDNFQKKLDEIGCDKLEEEFNRLVKEKLDLWK